MGYRSETPVVCPSAYGDYHRKLMRENPSVLEGQGAFGGKDEIYGDTSQTRILAKESIRHPGTSGADRDPGCIAESECVELEYRSEGRGPLDPRLFLISEGLVDAVHLVQLVVVRSNFDSRLETDDADLVGETASNEHVGEEEIVLNRPVSNRASPVLRKPGRRVCARARPPDALGGCHKVSDGPTSLRSQFSRLQLRLP